MKIKRLYILFAIVLFICGDLFSEEYRLKQIELDSQYKLDKEILENYGNLWICYQFSNKTYQLYGSEWIPIRFIEIYYKNNTDFVFIGKIDVNGIYDKNNELICKNILLKNRFYGYTPLGLTERSLTDPFYTGQYLLNTQNEFGGLDPYASISIDFDINSIIVTHASD